MQGIKNGKMASTAPQPRLVNKADVNRTQQVVSSGPWFLNQSGTTHPTESFNTSVKTFP